MNAEMSGAPLRGIRGRLLSFLRAPSGAGDAASYRYIDDGLVLIAGDGRIEATGPAAELMPRVTAGAQVAHHPGALIMPGFIDPHIHYPQTQVIASYGAQLLEWLEKYTFVEEQKFADREHAMRNADFFLDELFRNGTTTACAYCTAHPISADALFTAARERNAGMIAGNSVMNRNGPPGLLAPAASAIADSRELIKRWHGTGRQRYAVTPRFAITSTDAQLAELGGLVKEFPTVLLQTHLDENLNEIAAIKKLFPDDASYTAVYHRFGLLGPRSLMGHCIHMDDAEVAYKVMQLQGQNLPALSAFDLMTRGNAAALKLAGEIGAIAPGAYADLVVLDARATPAMAHRMEVARSLEDELFVLTTLGDDRVVQQTYIGGKAAL